MDVLLKRTPQLKKNTASQPLHLYRYDSQNWPVIFDYLSKWIDCVNSTALDGVSREVLMQKRAYDSLIREDYE
jgi:hypothetical protein